MTVLSSLLTQGYFLNKFEDLIREELKNSVAEAKREVEIVKDEQIADCRAEIEDLTTKLTSLESLVASRNTMIQSLDVDLTALRKENSQLQESLARSGADAVRIQNLLREVQTLAGGLDCTPPPSATSLNSQESSFDFVKVDEIAPTPKPASPQSCITNPLSEQHQENLGSKDIESSLREMDEEQKQETEETVNVAGAPLGPSPFVLVSPAKSLASNRLATLFGRKPVVTHEEETVKMEMPHDSFCHGANEVEVHTMNEKGGSDNEGWTVPTLSEEKAPDADVKVLLPSAAEKKVPGADKLSLPTRAEVKVPDGST